MYWPTEEGPHHVAGGFAAEVDHGALSGEDAARREA